jgi:hypothetical protein
MSVSGPAAEGEPPATGDATAPAARADGAAGNVARRDDRLALATIVLGAATAFLGVRVPPVLMSGVALGLAGVLLAVRGDRPVPMPRLLTAGLVLAVAAVAGTALIGLYEEWIVGQQLAEGASTVYVTASMRPYARAAAGLRSLGLFAALSMLLGAAVTRFSGK